MPDPPQLPSQVGSSRGPNDGRWPITCDAPVSPVHPRAQTASTEVSGWVEGGSRQDRRRRADLLSGPARRKLEPRDSVDRDAHARPPSFRTIAAVAPRGRGQLNVLRAAIARHGRQAACRRPPHADRRKQRESGELGATYCKLRRGRRACRTTPRTPCEQHDVPIARSDRARRATIRTLRSFRP